jgi:murein L,D-transpeptidase YcbB/YkuD
MKQALFGLVAVCSLGLLLTSCAGHRGAGGQYAHLLESSDHPQVRRLHSALPRYQQLATQAWPQIAYQGRLEPGDQSNVIPVIRARLMKLGDMPDTGYSESQYYGPHLAQAVMRFQKRHGLEASATIGPQTMAALNVPPGKRLAELVDSMQRWAKMPTVSGEKYVHVNIPSYDLNVMDGTRSLIDMRVVVGLPSWPTPEITSEIKTIVLNPSWNVPRNITEREIVHHMVKNPNYLTENELKIYKDWRKKETIDPATIDWQEYAGSKDLPYLISQDPGRTNALGDVKFLFPNEHSVYLHDTQAKGLFARDQRAFSHGCIRLQNPLLLYNYLVAEDGTIDMGSAENHRVSGNTKYLALKKKMPLYITYMTAWVDDYGQLQFRKDIYNKI